MKKSTVRIPVSDISSLLRMSLIVFAVVGVIFIGLAIINRVRASVQHPDQNDTPETLAESFRQSLVAGEISEAEYQRITSKLGVSRGKKPKPPTDPLD